MNQPAPQKVRTVYAETGILVDLCDNVARVWIGSELCHIHGTKVFINGKALV